MESIVVTWREILLLGAIVLFVYVAEAVMFLLKLRKIRPSSSNTDTKVLQQQIDDLALRFDSLQQSLLTPLPPPDVPKVVDPAVVAPAPVRDTPSAYGRAIELARQGLDPDSLAVQCGISRGEAELIIALHRFDSA